jgi:acetyl-CoA carboxylase biotin carboxyl carrier protein
MNLTQRDVGDIQQLLDGSDYDELVLETATQRLLLRRMQDGGWTQELVTFAGPKLVGDAVGQTTNSSRTGATAEVRAGLVNIHPPLPGTFYRAPKPGAQPFVEVGSRVTTDTVIGIVETMKLMNPVSSGIFGEIAEICIPNGTFVETSDVLARVRPLEVAAV